MPRIYHGMYRICHKMYSLEVTDMLPKNHSTQVNHHKQKGSLFPTYIRNVQVTQEKSKSTKAHIFIPTTNTSWTAGSLHVLASLLHHHSQKHIKCGKHIQPTSQHVLLHHHCLLQHYNYNQKNGQHQECYIQTTTDKTNAASHAFPILTNHFLHLVQTLL